VTGSILLVEDDEPLRTIVGRHLRTHGYVVDEVESAEAAIRELENGLRPALVLLDINLPGDTGWDVMRAPAYEVAGRPDVLVVTATTISPRRLREFGVAGYLPKPFPLETLIDTIERLLTTEEAQAQT
jgi:DNA-binding response OmpR family regulator